MVLPVSHLLRTLSYACALVALVACERREAVPAVPQEKQSLLVGSPKSAAPKDDVISISQTAIHPLIQPGERVKISGGGEPVVLNREIRAPESIVQFREWLARYVAADSSARAALEAEGRLMLKQRREDVANLITSDPEAAILLSPNSAERALLPDDMSSQLEQVVSGSGFYGVKATCSHGPDAPHGDACRIEHEIIIEGQGYAASIYGTRRERLTEEDASLYGVALDGVIALHSDDVVILPGVQAGQVSVVYRGLTQAINETDLPTYLQTLSTP